eukprot:TRINITY_DN9157_c0_g1_i1.p1 TRINITY_DN9157_c0_g1~~TRINITY_DN9157_c0_g1_i1.p1  ORF type:complete len:301 (+),score=42.34 TRINITY_DN9157_c0_g1_i1:32-934(+)
MCGLIWSLVVMILCPLVLSQCDWNYNRPNYDWPMLNCEHSCGGSLQSPVNIATYRPAPHLTPLNFVGYEDAAFTLSNQGHTLELQMPEDYEGYFHQGYKLSHCHFHTPAENTIDAIQYPLSMHCFHKTHNVSPLGIKVLTFLFEMVESPENPWLGPLVAAIPLVRNLSATDRVPVAMDGLHGVFGRIAGKKDSYVNFLGSLTEPPCTEGVEWFVMLSPLTVSRLQYETFRSVMGSNFRPVQRNLYDVEAFVRETHPAVWERMGSIPIYFWGLLGVLVLVIVVGVVISLRYLKKCIGVVRG